MFTGRTRLDLNIISRRPIIKEESSSFSWAFKQVWCYTSLVLGITQKICWELHLLWHVRITQTMQGDLQKITAHFLSQHCRLELHHQLGCHISVRLGATKSAGLQVIKQWQWFRCLSISPKWHTKYVYNYDLKQHILINFFKWITFIHTTMLYYCSKYYSESSTDLLNSDHSELSLCLCYTFRFWDFYLCDMTYSSSDVWPVQYIVINQYETSGWPI